MTEQTWREHPGMDDWDVLLVNTEMHGVIRYAGVMSFDAPTSGEGPLRLFLDGGDQLHVWSHWPLIGVRWANPLREYIDSGRAEGTLLRWRKPDAPERSLDEPRRESKK